VVLVANKEQNTKIKYFSEYDAMTGVYNRRSGYGKLNELKKDIYKRNCNIAVCFIDINGLKDVNDHLGHDAGDELIQSVVEVIRDNVRGNDFVARLGGDEFLIVFDSLDEEGAEKVWERIVQKYAQINADEDRRYVISVSHGIGMFRCSSDESIDDVINRADAKMYGEKREIKKTLNVIRK
jgi:diguanylate cyclase (GGDEF)-like protein